MQNYLLTLAYDGTNYCGFQVQPNGRSVAATFQDALEAVLGSRPDIKGCSRTDAGVHALGFRLNFDGDNMHVTVPTWRSTGDVAIKADIMEEVARMAGYENFQAAPITTSFDGAINQLDKDLERRIKEYLAIRCGMQEIFTLSLIHI